jgi:RNA-binding protein
MLSQQDKKKFRAIGHHLNPVVTISGNGLSESVLAELNRALTDHELIKIRINGDRDQRASILAAILENTTAIKIQATGGTAVVYKKALEPKAHLSNVARYG